MSKKVIAVISVAVVLIIAAAVGLFLFFRTGGPYSGKVTEADTGNPVSGVMVTDGRNVVKTDENGQFTLRGTEKHVLSLLLPSQATPVRIFIFPHPKILRNIISLLQRMREQQLRITLLFRFLILKSEKTEWVTGLTM